jgi:hypothetical protein
MSFWIAGATVVSTGVGAYSANKASKESAKGIKSGLAQSLELTNKARQDVINLFDMSSKKTAASTGAALDFYKQNAQARTQPYLQGNQGAQRAIGLGATQVNNAILGLPVDMSFTNQPQVQADYTGIQGATLPQQGQTFADQEAARVAAIPVAAPVAAKPSSSGGILGGIADNSGVGRAIKGAPEKTVKEVKRFIKKVF